MITKDQAQMLAALAVACRPHRAPTWDEAGVVANIAKVKDRQLAEVALAVIRAAADRECVSPGVIPSAGSHWQEQLKPAKWEPDLMPPDERCAVCSKRQRDCQSAAMPDHTFITAAAHAAQVAARGYDTAAIVTDIKGAKEPMRPRETGEPVESDEEPAARIAALKAQLGYHDKGDAA